MKQYLMILYVGVLSSTSFAADSGSGHYIAPGRFLKSCEAVMRSEVAKVAGPEMLRQITDYRAEAKNYPDTPSVSGLDIEKWPLYDAKKYSLKNVVLPDDATTLKNEADRYSQTPDFYNDLKAIIPNSSAVGTPETYTQERVVYAYVPNTKVGFGYTVVTAFTVTSLHAKGQEYQQYGIKIQGAQPSVSECITELKYEGTID